MRGSRQSRFAALPRHFRRRKFTAATKRHLHHSSPSFIFLHLLILLSREGMGGQANSPDGKTFWISHASRMANPKRLAIRDALGCIKSWKQGWQTLRLLQRMAYFISSMTSSGDIEFPTSSFGAFLRKSIGIIVWFFANGNKLTLRSSSAVSCFPSS